MRGLTDGSPRKSASGHSASQCFLMSYSGVQVPSGEQEGEKSLSEMSYEGFSSAFVIKHKLVYTCANF